MDPRHYSLNIQWDDQGQIYVVEVPEFSGCMTHGKTYDEAIQNALEVIELWIEDMQKVGQPVPAPRMYATV